MLYSLLRPLVFALEPETAHRIAFSAMEAAHRLGLSHVDSIPCRSRRLMGLTFPNPVGLAAGLDKNGEHIDALADLGFGFIEIGTVTPRPQLGNPKPRLFRIAQENAIINRMGFNNNGIERLIANVKTMNYKGILGINIGKNFDTPVEKAVDDYLICLRKAYRYASYITVNISSPNTPNLRQLQHAAELNSLLSALKLNQQRLADEQGKYTPLVIKIAPDLELPEIDSIAALLVKHQIDGVIATNTTLSRAGVETLPNAREAGGLSGAPLAKRATAVIARLHHALQGALPIIGAGGVMDATGATEKIEAGASLIQVYSGLIYRGPHLVREIAQVLCNPNGAHVGDAGAT